MKPITQQILLSLTGCIALTLIFSFGLSTAVNFGIAQFEQKAQEFLPTTGQASQLQNP
jgi:hypothetical protein